MSCFVSGCKTGYVREKWSNKEAGKKNYSLFSVRTEEIASVWGSVIPRKDKILKKGDKVCELHFSESSIERDYVTLMPDGTIVRIPKGRPNLKPDAIPSIFTQEEINALQREKLDLIRPQLIIEKPAGKEEEKLDSVKDQEPIVGQAEEPAVTIKEEEVSVSESESLLDYRCHDLEDSVSDASTLSNASAKSDLDFRDVMKKLEDQSPHATILRFYESIKTPSESWLPCVTHGYAMWCLWKKDLSGVDRRVVISPDMSVRIYVDEKELPIPGMDRVEGIEDVPEVLDTVSRILPCPSSEDCEEQRKNCVGYILKKKRNQTGPQRNRCDPCCQRRKTLMKKRKRRTSEKWLERMKRREEKEISKLKLGKKLPLTKRKDKEADSIHKEA